MQHQVWLDTDIGSDIDDAVCLGYLLANRACKLVGITTVSGDATMRASLASVLCEAAGRDIPIYPGAEQPLLVPQRQATAWQAGALARWPHQTRFPQGQALQAMRTAILENPGEITLLAIGPMTNVALLFAMDPAIPAQLKSLIMMIGKFSGNTPSLPPCEWSEWNAMLDPHAAAIVYHHQVKQHRSIGMDVTLQVTMDAASVRQRFQAPLLQPVLDVAEIWFEHRDCITFHDPLAAVSIFEPDVCQYKAGRVALELNNPQLSGMTVFDAGDQSARHEVAVQVDRELFFESFFAPFSRQQETVR